MTVYIYICMYTPYKIFYKSFLKMPKPTKCQTVWTAALIRESINSANLLSCRADKYFPYFSCPLPNPTKRFIFPPTHHRPIWILFRGGQKALLLARQEPGSAVLPGNGTHLQKAGWHLHICKTISPRSGSCPTFVLAFLCSVLHPTVWAILRPEGGEQIMSRVWGRL